jgi:hypothetical protein
VNTIATFICGKRCPPLDVLRSETPERERTHRGIGTATADLATADIATTPFMQVGSEGISRFSVGCVDMVISLEALHNLGLADLSSAFWEIEQSGAITPTSWSNRTVPSGKRSIFLYGQLTCRSFYAADDGEWSYRTGAYHGDYGPFFE